MKKISCFIPYSGKEQVEKTIENLQVTGLVKEIYLVTTNDKLETLPGCQRIWIEYPFSSLAMEVMAHETESEYTLLYTKETTLEMLDEMIDEDSAIVSIYYGSDSSMENAEELSACIEEKYPDVEIEINDGGQPIYYYVISVE